MLVAVSLIGLIPHVPTPTSSTLGNAANATFCQLRMHYETNLHDKVNGLNPGVSVVCVV